LRSLHLLLESILILLTILLVAEYRSGLVESLLRRYHIKIGSVELIDLRCIRMERLHIREEPLFEEALLCIRYSDLLRGLLHLDVVKISKIDLNLLQKLSQRKREKRSSPKIPFLIDTLLLDGSYRYRGKNSFDLKALGVSPQKATIERLHIDTFAASTRAFGNFFEGNLSLKGELMPKREYLAQKLSKIDPASIERIDYAIDTDFSLLRFALATKATRLWQDLNATLKARGLYHLKALRLQAFGKLYGEYNRSKLASDLLLKWERKKWHLAGSGKLYNETYPIRIKHSFYKEIDLEFNATSTKADLLASNPYFTATATIEPKTISFATSPIKLIHLLTPPRALQKSWLQIRGEWKPERIAATLHSDIAKAQLLLAQKELRGTIWPKKLSNLHLEPLGPIRIRADLKEKKATATSPLFSLRGSWQKKIYATLSIPGATSTLAWEKNASLRLDVASLREVAKSVSKIYPLKLPPIDAKASIRIVFDPRTKRYAYRIEAPRIITDLAPLSYLVMEGEGHGNEILIRYYGAAFGRRSIYATKPSRIRIEKEKIVLDPFWIEDGIEVKGFYTKKLARFRLHTPTPYRYSSIEGVAILSGSLDVTINEEKRVTVEGGVTFHEGSIGVRLRQKKSISDPDIIIVDAPKKENGKFFRQNVALNVKIDAKKPLLYKIPDLEVHFIPDLLIWKEFGKELQLLGYIRITKGLYHPFRDRYIIEPSYIYFYGNPSDPILELFIKTHKQHYIIYITISGNLKAPILRFESDPYLPPKDILPLLLMGNQSSSLFLKATGGDRLIGTLGNLFLKDLLASVGISLDSLTLTATGNRIGFEIGKHIGEKITIIYKNDEVSTIIIRYLINDKLESEVIFGPHKSGINLFYREIR